MRQKALIWLFVAAACIPAAIAQEQPSYVQQFCVKAVAGKLSSLDAMIPDVAKVMQVRIEEGQLTFFAALKAVIPAGASARCDYALSYGYTGFPPEPRTREQAEATFRKAKVAGTYAEMLAKRDATSMLVSDDLWRGVTDGMAGPGSVKGSYVRLNLYKSKPGHTIAEWAKMEVEGWKPFAEALAKETPGFGWRAESLTMPAGSSLHYNAMTVDIFPNWAATGHGYSAEMWNKVHPDLKSSDYLAKVNEVVDRYKVELYRTVEVVRKN
jgi:hypothetical protein